MRQNVFTADKLTHAPTGALDVARIRPRPVSRVGAAGLVRRRLYTDAMTSHFHRRPPLPRWLLAVHAETAVAETTGRGRTRGSFLAAFLAGVARLTAAAVAGERLSGTPGLLQGVDPRAKLVGVLVLIVVAALLSALPALLLLVAVAVALALASRVGIARLAVRAWLWVPLFTGLLAMPAAFNVVTPGQPVWTIVEGDGATWWSDDGSLSVTREGVEVALRLLLRVTATVSFAVLLTLTTRWDDLLRALRAVRVPRTFVFVLAAAYRYVFLLARLLADMGAARAARLVGPVSRGDDRRFAAAAAGTLFGHSQALAAAVHEAMLARGYEGEVRTLSRWRLGVRDLVWSALVAAAAAAALALEAWAS
jgi:cobalt/nickel transport system permease protein